MGRVVIPGFRKIETSGGGEGGTTNYEDLTNKPSINNVPLVGNLSTVDLKLTDATLTEEGVPAEAKTVGQKLEEQSTSLTALSGQLGSHTVKSDVPENAVFTDTVYDDTEVQKRISDNGYGEVAGGKNLVSSIKLGANCSENSEQFIIHDIWGDNREGALLSTCYLNADISYCVSMDIKVSSNDPLYYVYIYEDDTVGGINTISEITKTEDYQRISYNLTPDKNVIGVYFGLNHMEYMGYIKKNTLQIEEGTQATSYEPYFPSNKMLAEEKADKSETTVNLLNPTLQTTTINGITCTNNGDGTYTLNGTASAHTSFSLTLYNDRKGKFKVVGCPKNGSNTTYSILVVISNKSSGTWKSYEEEYGSGIIFENYDDNYVFSIDIRVAEGATVNNIVFKPMLTTNLDATYDDFVQYTGDSGKLNSDVADIKKDLDKLSSLPIGTIIQIDAAKDDIETTTQKYGWQYLGKSNIEYDRGSATLLVTNVYRKNE